MFDLSKTRGIGKNKSSLSAIEHQMLIDQKDGKVLTQPGNTHDAQTSKTINNIHAGEKSISGIGNTISIINNQHISDSQYDYSNTA